jgi:GT2 family glycosyltransferase
MASQVSQRASTDATPPRCAIIIPTYNGAALTEACLETLLASPPADCSWTIVVVDDGSTDGTPAALARFGDRITLIEQRANAGFASACNAGARAAGDADFLVFLNNDTLPTSGWLDALVAEALTNAGVAAVGAKLLFPNGQVQHAGIAIGQDRVPHHLYAGFDGEHPAVNRAKTVAAATAACLLVRRDAFEQLGGLDTDFHNGYEDVDFCLRLGQRGLLVRYCPGSVVYHLESVTRWPTGVPVNTEANQQLYEQRWGSLVVPDDLQHYLDDGLLTLSYDSHYPLTLAVSPDLAVIRRDGEPLTGVEQLLALRSTQVMDLLSAQVRSRIAGPKPGRGTTSAHEPLRGDRVLHGREHQLGDRDGKHLISVLLPVKDGARHLSNLLPAVLGQSISARLEIVAVDSGSEDDTIKVLEAFGATVISIDPSDFDHGLTRNLAAEHARGDILIFLSQRSLPVGDRWLAPLIARLDADPALAGACSRVTPHPDADVLTRRDVERDLSASTERRRMQIDDWSAYRRMSSEQRRMFMNFHTVSAAINAEAWRRTPFRSVRTLGEDLLWAREVLEAGRALAHEPASVVFHSHSYTLEELLARNVDDGIANRDIVDRSLERDQVGPMIRAMTQDDWGYLRDTVGLTGDELEHWQLEAVLRRTAQAAGQWIGINNETLPDDTAEFFSSVAHLRSRGRYDPGRDR